MTLFDVKFDNGKGDANLNLEVGVLEVIANETNPEFPAQFQINVPLDPIIDKLIAQAPNWWIAMGEKAAKVLLDNV